MASPARIRATIATVASPPEELRELRAFHKALSDPTRLRLLRRLADGPATVSDLVQLVDLSQPLVSWHVRTLKGAGLVETRRVGREVICTLCHEALHTYRQRELDFLGLAS